VSRLIDREDPTKGGSVTMVVRRQTTWRPQVRLPRHPHRVGDPLMVGLVALVVYALHGYQGLLDRDLGMFVYGGEHVARGTPPYVAMFNSVGPLADAVPGLAIWLGHLVGVDPVLSARLFFTVLSAGCCALLCVLARDTLGSRTAGFLAPAVFLTFEGFSKLASDGPREKTTMVLFLLGCLILLGRRRWAAAGACAALATLTWQPVLAVVLTALLVAALLDQRDRRRRILLRFVAGGAVPSLATVCYFLAAGALGRAYAGFVVINVGYTHQPSPLAHPGDTWPLLWNTYGVPLLVAIAGMVALVVLGIRAIPVARRPTVSPVARRLTVTAAGGAVGTVWTLLAMNGSADLFVLLPFAALGVTGAVLVALSHLPRRAAFTGAVAVMCLAVGYAGVWSVTSRDHRLELERADVNAVLRSQPPDAVIISINAPQVLAIAQRSTPVRFQYFSADVERYLDGTYPGGMRGYIQGLQRHRPTIVALGSTFRGLWPYGWLTRDYVRIGTGVGVTWYVARAAGPAAIDRARLAHTEAMRAHGR
jgi:hypothetical protein